VRQRIVQLALVDRNRSTSAPSGCSAESSSQLTWLPMYCVAGPTGRRAKNGWCLSSVDTRVQVATFKVAAALGSVGTKALDRLGTLASARRRATIRA
jgi:hypothetical protein